MAEKMKSVSTKGIDWGVPLKSPSPNQLPLEIANSDWVI